MKLNRNLKRATLGGFVVIEATPRTLQIDLDGALAVRRYGWQYQLFKRAGLTKGWRETIEPSKTKGHVHITIKLPRPLPLKERIAIAAILGDDHKRAAFNWIRACKRSRVPVAFFRKA